MQVRRDPDSITVAFLARRFLMLHADDIIQQTAACVKACVYSTRRSAAVPRFIPVSRNEKFDSRPVPFSLEERIILFCVQCDCAAIE